MTIQLPLCQRTLASMAAGWCGLSTAMDPDMRQECGWQLWRRKRALASSHGVSHAAPPSAYGDAQRAPLLVPEQPCLHAVLRGGQAKAFIGERGGDAAAGGAGDIAFLHEIGLDHIFDGVARF